MRISAKTEDPANGAEAKSCVGWWKKYSSDGSGIDEEMRVPCPQTASLVSFS
jgi:hypothetical protein